MARSIWSGTISFGLVNIPIKLATAVRERTIQFHQLHKTDNVRVKYKKVCPAEGDKELSADDIVRGYEVSRDHYVVVGDEEMEQLAPQASRTVDILDFVELSRIDPIYYDRAYYVLPDERSQRAYQLLVQAMHKTGRVAIARFVMRQKEYLAAIRPLGSALCLEVMHYADEVVPAERLEEVPADKPAPQRELDMAVQLIESLAGPFDPRKYHDEYTERVEKMLQAKAEGQEVVTSPPPERPARVLDLMKALEQSLAEARKKQPAKPPARRKRKTA